MNDIANKPFGTVFTPNMSLSRFANATWSPIETVTSDAISLSPAAHVLHYASSCFEGLKAYKVGNEIAIFRLEKHIQRMQNTARALSLPIPDEALLREMIISILDHERAHMPDTPAAMYIRPTLIGTEPAIGKAASPSETALLYILLSIVGDYFKSGGSGLSLLLEDRFGRTAPGMVSAKAGANYASALNAIDTARGLHPNIDQVLFAPNGIVQETGAANFFLIDDSRVITGSLNSEFLPGVTRDSLLIIANDLGYETIERDVTLDEVIEWSNKGGEAALSGTAATLSPIASIIYRDTTYPFSIRNDSNSAKLKQRLQAIQFGKTDDTHGWRTII